METDIYKHRSAASCVASAYNLITANAKTVLRRTWLPVLIYAVASPVVFLVATWHLNYVSYHEPMSVGVALALLLAFVVGMVALVWLYARVYQLFNGLMLKHNVKRQIRWLVLLLVVGMALGVLTGGMGYALASSQGGTSRWAFAGMAVLAIVALVLLLPLLYVWPAYMLSTDDKPGRRMWQYYRVGFRHWGFIFTAMFVCAMIAALFSLIMALPTLILMIAHVISFSGFVGGDDLNLPAYFGLLDFSVTTLTMFLSTYVSIWMAIVGCYVYGSIKTK